MTNAERQQLYRRRKRLATLEAYANPKGKPTKDVLRALEQQLAMLDAPDEDDSHMAARRMVGLALGELCRRYKVKPISSR